MQWNSIIIISSIFYFSCFYTLWFLHPLMPTCRSFFCLLILHTEFFISTNLLSFSINLIYFVLSTNTLWLSSTSADVVGQSVTTCVITKKLRKHTQNNDMCHVFISSCIAFNTCTHFFLHNFDALAWSFYVYASTKSCYILLLMLNYVPFYFRNSARSDAIYVLNGTLLCVDMDLV